MTSPGINVHHHANDESWAQKVAKGLQAKVPAPMNSRDLMSDQIHYTAVTLYEDEHLKDQIRIHRAEQIIQQTLEEEARQYLLEVTFVENQHACDAIEKGIIINEVNYRASPTRLHGSTQPLRMTRVFLNYVPKKQSVLKEGILESMKFYGKVCEIKKMMNGNFFEGQISILLDTNDDGVDKKCRPLQRMLYMSHWDRYIPATFKGAPPVCYQCRQAGHIRKECPVMKHVVIQHIKI
ncbi:uncharacterized protein BX664DRAFT_358151 [Halteromyces radiatus]|uniref:uncharacterized protein n=1 Tax=Halteromyces radiatus TaxID=101107 RepID=UPI00221E7604|nr:uncharacterized protein BX664DRAFT_358151 [Halteromyces radiatus]KAI8093748.1 hypothetical protein BX664DRAFT_358151 [Halteromyces radiatus]